MKNEISIEIDDLTPCLRRLSDGSIINTNVKEMTQHTLPKKSDNWEFNWKKQLEISDSIYGLYADGDSRLQGLVALTAYKEMSAIHVELAESAPHNNPHNKTVLGQEYTGVGPHLFAYAIKESFEKGYNGCIFFEAKTDLIRHYESKFGARRIGSSYRMVIDGDAARILYDIYY